MDYQFHVDGQSKSSICFSFKKFSRNCYTHTVSTRWQIHPEEQINSPFTQKLTYKANTLIKLWQMLQLILVCTVQLSPSLHTIISTGTFPLEGFITATRKLTTWCQIACTRSNRDKQWGCQLARVNQRELQLARIATSEGQLARAPLLAGSSASS